MRDRRGWVVPVVVSMFSLAIGLVLGSGPLRTALIGSLGAQVATLEDQVADAQRDAQRSGIQNEYGAGWTDVIAPQYLAGTLSGRSVATVAFEGANTDAVAGVQERLTQAGASVAASVTVTDLWNDPNKSAFRAALAPQLAPSISGLSGNEPVDEVFARALAQALMPTLAADDADATDAAVGGAQDQAQALWTLMADAGLVEGTRDASADSIVMVAGEPPKDEDVASSQAATAMTVVAAFARYDAALVATNGPDSEGDLVSSILVDADVLAPRISTVTWIETPFSQVTVALALREQLDGWVGHYGPGEDREAAPPPAP